MSKLLKKYFFVLQTIEASSSQEFLNAVMKDRHLKGYLLKMLPEIAVNMLELNLPMTKLEISKIKRNFKLLKILASKKAIDNLRFIRFCCILVVRYRDLIGI